MTRPLDVDCSMCKAVAGQPCNRLRWPRTLIPQDAAPPPPHRARVLRARAFAEVAERVRNEPR